MQPSGRWYWFPVVSTLPMCVTSAPVNRYVLALNNPSAATAQTAKVCCQGSVRIVPTTTNLFCSFWSGRY